MSAVLAEWRPTLAVFLRRCLVVGGLTVLAFGGFGLITGFWQILFAAPVLIAAYTFLFDDHLRWLGVRHDRWELTAQELIHHGYEGVAHLPLHEIEDVTTRFGWTVLVKLRSGLRVEMAYVPAPKEIADRILAARNGLGDATEQDRTT